MPKVNGRIEATREDSSDCLTNYWSRWILFGRLSHRANLIQIQMLMVRQIAMTAASMMLQRRNLEPVAVAFLIPIPTVMVQQMNSRSVSVMGAGAVRQGVVALSRRMRVLDAIVAMGGFSVWAKKSRVTVLREGPEGREEYRFNYTAYVDGKAPGTNLLLEPGDTVIVPD